LPDGEPQAHGDKDNDRTDPADDIQDSTDHR